ncbi:hypothetical protein [Nannocystis bainbridge]|uniref:SMP-30/Gluconolactonase/LRE-like region domain-containing protein n=1 Tax=Nannocystis bainbridge TaxID=2995303 RepID=A0ABT5E7B0_9BACT|nr:hypothetical protein [Nannocystis bainbridge]MDC0721747.1 hypothetical protein [Nannocystis bainbridge]
MIRPRATAPLLLLLGACQAGGGDTDATTTTADTSTSTSGQVSSTTTGTGEPTTTGTTTTTGTGEPTTTGTTTGTTDPDETTDTDGAAPIVVEGLSVPESILHDVAADVYLISNINGTPTATDDNGFISRVLPDGTVDQLAFIDGADPEVTLDAPKGMAIVGDFLYVSDITVVRKFDRTTGAPLATIAIDGAGFLNDLSADASGNVYVGDMQVEAIHVINPADEPTLLFESSDLQNPNGLLADDQGVHVVTNGGTKLLYVPRQMPVVMELFDLEASSLDGLAPHPAGGWLVSSWETSAVYHVSADLQTAAVVVADISSPADIGVDTGRERVLIPVFTENRAEFHLLAP